MSLVTAAVLLLPACSDTHTHTQSPSLIRTVALNDGSAVLQPVRVQAVGDTLFVSYKGISRLDKYDLELNRIGKIELRAPKPIVPSAFSVSDSQIVVCDHTNRAIVLFDRAGGFIDSYGTLPDERTKLLPLAIAWHEGVAYVADMALKQVLAVSTMTKEGVVDRGELILQIPKDGAKSLGLPSSVFVTPDGRLLVGDAGDGIIKVFTCDGQEVYNFDRLPGGAKIAPHGFAVDDVRDPGLQREDAFDPSGLPNQGRIHVVDGRAGSVHIFNPLGNYIASYPEGHSLDGPSDIAISVKTQRIFVADSRAKRIHVFGYGKEL